MRSIAIAAVLFIAPVLAEVELSGTPPASKPYLGEDARAVDLVICLDNSGSMKPLLDGVRAGLWDVVNVFGEMRPTPALRVGLLTYGSRDSTVEAGWVVMRSDLSHDLDQVYAELMLVPTGGDEEFVGWALRTALETMSWSEERDALKIIFIAGNESADQGVEMHDFRDVAQDALRDGVIINAVYAGAQGSGVRDKWLELAVAGEGEFSAVPHLDQIPQIVTPQDAALEDLNAQLNATYLPIGRRGEQGVAGQAMQDRNAAQLGPQSFGSRVATKSSPQYNNASWDLVDAASQPGFDWNDVAQSDLPEELRGLDQVELILFVEETRTVRENLRQQVREVSAAREQHVRSVLGKEYPGTLGIGDAMKNTIRSQAVRNGFTRDE